MTEKLSSPSAMDLRAELQDKVLKDLLGPAAGPEEEVDERNVRGRYILGLLAPKGQSVIPDQQDELGFDGADDSEEGKADTAIPQTASMLPSSIGLTFTVDGNAESIQVTAGDTTAAATAKRCSTTKGSPRESGSGSRSKSYPNQWRCGRVR